MHAGHNPLVLGLVPDDAAFLSRDPWGSPNYFRLQNVEEWSVEYFNHKSSFRSIANSIEECAEGRVVANSVREKLPSLVFGIQMAMRHVSSLPYLLDRIAALLGLPFEMQWDDGDQVAAEMALHLLDLSDQCPGGPAGCLACGTPKYSVASDIPFGEQIVVILVCKCVSHRRRVLR